MFNKNCFTDLDTSYDDNLDLCNLISEMKTECENNSKIITISGDTIRFCGLIFRIELPARILQFGFWRDQLVDL